MDISDDLLVYLAKRRVDYASIILLNKYESYISYWTSLYLNSLDQKRSAVEDCKSLLFKCVDCYDNTKGLFFVYFREACFNYLKGLYNYNKYKYQTYFYDDIDNCDSGYYILNDGDDVEFRLELYMNSLELDILSLKAEGYKYEEIKDKLDINGHKIDNTIQKAKRIINDKYDV